VRINDRVVYSGDFNVWLNGTTRSYTVPRSALSLPPVLSAEVPILLQTWDADSLLRGADDHDDVNPERSLKDLRLLNDRATGTYRGDTFGMTLILR